MQKVDSKFIVRVMLVVLAVAILYILVAQYQKQQPTITKEKFTRSDRVESRPTTWPSIVQEEAHVERQTATQPIPSEPSSNDMYKAVDFETESKLPSTCFPRDKLTAADLLPKDAANSKWAQVAPTNEQGDQNFLTAGHMVGIDTIGQSMRNANYQLRSDVPIARFAVGPWNQSTIEFDSSRRFFEIGAEEC